MDTGCPALMGRTPLPPCRNAPGLEGQGIEIPPGPQTVYGPFCSVGALRGLLPGGRIGKDCPSLCGLGRDSEQGSTPRRAETRPGRPCSRQQSHEQPAPYCCPHCSRYRRGPSTSQTLGIRHQTLMLTHPESAGAQVHPVSEPGKAPSQLQGRGQLRPHFQLGEASHWTGQLLQGGEVAAAGVTKMTRGVPQRTGRWSAVMGPTQSNRGSSF